MAKAPVKKAAPAAAPAAAKAVTKAPVKKAAAPAPAPEPEIVEETVPQPEIAEQAEPSHFDHLVDAARSVDAKFAMPHAKEAEQAFYKRLLGVVAEVPEEVWNAIPEPAQVWFNDAAAAVEANKPIAVLEGYASRPKPEAPADAAPKAEKGAGLAAYRAKVAAEKAAGTYVAPAKKEKPAKEPTVKGPNRISTIREYAILNPNATNEQILAHLATVGLGETNPSTVSITAAGARAAMDFIKASGHWKD
jgi:hypothetical protein